LRFRYVTLKNGKAVKKAVVYTQDEHSINRADVDSDAVLIVERLMDAGFETYIVGGAVRDLILKKKPKDFDIVSAANPNQIKKLFRNARIIGHRFRLVHVSVGAKLFEVSTFRSITEGFTSNSFGTIEEDVLRRDFTLNALFYDPKKQLVIDYVGGVKDIQKRRIKPVISLKTIFTDDPVRMIRAVKYAAATGFDLPLNVGWKIRQHSALLSQISPSRLTEEIFKIIRSSYAAKIIENLENYGLYRYLQPIASENMRENPAFREKYLQKLAQLNQGDAASLDRESLAALIQDHLETVIDWNDQNAESYREAFLEARQFILPMNPPRFELEAAIKSIYKQHGVIINRSLFVKRERRFQGGKFEKDELQPESDASRKADAQKTRKRKRNRKKSPPPDIDTN
jgi:poly(A) polymerase